MDWALALPITAGIICGTVLAIHFCGDNAKIEADGLRDKLADTKKDLDNYRNKYEAILEKRLK